MAKLEDSYARTNDSLLRNRVEMALLKAAAAEIDADGTAKAYALTLLNQSTAQAAAQNVLRYLIAKFEDVPAPTDEQITAVVAGVFAKMAGG